VAFAIAESTQQKQKMEQDQFAGMEAAISAALDRQKCSLTKNWKQSRGS